MENRSPFMDTIKDWGEDLYILGSGRNEDHFDDDMMEEWPENNEDEQEDIWEDDDIFED